MARRGQNSDDTYSRRLYSHILHSTDALKIGIRFQKFVMDAWFKALAAISKPVSY